MSRPFATDDDMPASQPQARGGAQARGATSSMKSILYGGEDSQPTQGSAAAAGGKKHGYAANGAAPAPFATSAQTTNEHQGYNIQPGDKGNKFAVGAEKIGGGPAGFDADVYGANRQAAHDIANAARQRNISGGGGIF
mmetsp:Transcript_24501/g.29691  ORF Transcript_24501/g.29691 Transcript_24501/m.29691 type:complete len:138 (+) Transcript_24501:191-604(+)|eukprot:CAMPEP_0197855166 /NCGR_PEP_ID=MMETSP1438-20131217/26111_1 /TAXON_ID=1461541 /ORGANISM="Pterosperma sp., Strain CCMP1384" /LENGTH=137 /DNA_ID=CAMNT_0043470171 /DNA_START=170 /DNA_END=583 /DNA_ORIENTATION=-